MTDGQELKLFIDNQPVSKAKIAVALKMSRQNLFQMFKTVSLEPETKKKFEEYFQTSIFTKKVYAVKNGNIDTTDNTGKMAFDAGEAIRKTEIIAEVLLSCVAELLAQSKNGSASVIQQQLEAVVNARLKNEEPKQ